MGKKSDKDPLGNLPKGKQDEILRTLFNPKRFKNVTGITPEYQYGPGPSTEPPIYTCRNCNSVDDLHNAKLRLIKTYIDKIAEESPNCNYEIIKKSRLVFSKLPSGR